jgi:hypothetical protein
MTYLIQLHSKKEILLSIHIEVVLSPQDKIHELWWLIRKEIHLVTFEVFHNETLSFDSILILPPEKKIVEMCDRPSIQNSVFEADEMEKNSEMIMTQFSSFVHQD